MHLEPALSAPEDRRARIALGAAADAGLAGVVLVPVGLVYDDRGRFRSDVEIHFGEPIEIDDWVENYRTDPVKAVRGITDLLADRLAQVTVNHGSSVEAALLDHVASLALAEQPSAPDFARRNRLRRALGSAVARAGGETSAEYKDIVAALNEHQRDLERLGIDHRDTSPLGATSYHDQVRHLTELVALTPPAVVGMVANAPTLLLLRVASRRVPHEAWQATVKGVGGTFLSPIVWAAEFGFLSRYIGRRRALMLTVTGAARGAVALVWRERLQRWQQQHRRRSGARALRSRRAPRGAKEPNCGSTVRRIARGQTSSRRSRLRSNAREIDHGLLSHPPETLAWEDNDTDVTTEASASAVPANTTAESTGSPADR